MKQHKTYDPKTKRYIEKTEQVGSLKKPDLCKGRRPHDLVLVLPEYISFKGILPDLTPEQIERYYEIEEERKIFDKSCDERIADELGIHKRVWNPEVNRHYQCINCGKKE